LCSPGCSLLPPPLRWPCLRDRSSRHTHSRFLCFSRSLSSCLGNIEVILLFGF